MSDPIGPMTIGLDSNGRMYPGVYIGGSNSRRLPPHCFIEASLGTNTAVAWLLFHFPSPLPSGTLKLHIFVMSNNTSGAAYAAVAWASLALSENFDTISLNSEGAAAAMHTWAAGEADKIFEYELTLDADTPVAGEFGLIQITFGNTASHNISTEVGCWFEIVWE